MSSRRATHAGSWYTSDGKVLSDQLGGWLLGAGQPTHSTARAIIAPHAGYSYSGECAGFAYKQVDPTNIDRVFVLGPSHKYHLKTCALSLALEYETPLGNMTINQDVYDDLKATRKFDYMTLDQDENEHSLEMHLPFIAHVMGSKSFTLVPVLVGSLSPRTGQEYGELFASYLADPRNLFVISSDFCHWGSRFSYTLFDESRGEKIYQFIEWLDRKGMKIIESMDPVGFTDYLNEYQNTICGRNPIIILLNMIDYLNTQKGLKMRINFVQYGQSSQCKRRSDSSVSYASAALVFD